jgi:2-polyprenyl-6-methoxyphenol hydroxylase-like FAD-dependent oxidoreductase
MLRSFTNHEQLTFASYGDVVMHRYHRDNLVCIGDAAHSMSPQLGQGANLGLIDAGVLAECLETLPVTAAFAEFSRRRRAHVRYYQFASRWLTPFFQSHSRTAAVIRDLAFPLIPYVKPAYREALRTVAGFKTGLIFDRSM